MYKHIFSLLILGIWSFSSFGQENEDLLVIAGEDVPKYWIAENIKAPRYPSGAAMDGIEGCAAIGFMIEKDGSTANHQPLGAYPTEVFLGPALEATRKWKFTPSDSNTSREPIFAVQIIDFTLGTGAAGDEADRKRISDYCASAVNKSLNQAASNSGAP